MKYRYRSQEEMKDSGVEWIGKIPKEWDVKRLKQVILEPLKYGANESAELDDTNLPRYIRISDFDQDGNLRCETFKSLSYEKAKDYYLEEGDILFARSGATVGKTFLFKRYKGKACFAGYLIKATANEKIIESEFLYKFTQSKGYENWKNSIFMQATIQNIGADKYKELKLTIPKKKEQKKIVNFLLEKTSQFDSIISKKEALIQRLEEAKKSLISEVVTGKVKVVKTSDGYELVERKKEEMKDSGVEWLGDVPREWGVKKLKYLFRIKKNIAGKIGYNVLSVTQSGIKIKDITKNEGQLSMDYSKYQIVEISDFIMNHMDLLTGFVDCSKFNGVTSPDYRVFRLINDSNCKDYYNYIFQSCYYNRIFYGLAQGVSGMGRWRLQTDKFLNFTLPIPSIEEQRQIAYALQIRLEDISKLKNALSLHIKKLNQAKQSLISEAVTGKIEILD
ncbi:MAG: hypothetical protein E7211_00180 [Clostridium lundense]|nr:hypothetical protein [Clostridium lundense]